MFIGKMNIIFREIYYSFAIPTAWRFNKMNCCIIAKICRKLGNDDLCKGLLESKNYKEVVEIPFLKLYDKVNVNREIKNNPWLDLR